MKKYTQIFVVLILAMTVIKVAGSSPVWASELPSDAVRPSLEIIITESGSYTIGGLCQFNAVYTGSGASSKVALDVPEKVSREVPFAYADQLYLAGCHIVHFTLDKVTSEMSPAYGSWEVCFGDRPDEKLTIYYYLDDPGTGSAVWLPLTTTVKDGFACAPASYTGVYAPGGSRLGVVPATGAFTNPGDAQPGSSGGTVRPPAPVETGVITKSGTYNIGGVCSIIIDYQNPNISNVVRVEKDIEVSSNVPFPDNQGLLYLPGCHVLHYRADKLITDASPSDGSWKICFASIPNKETIIYFYYANDDTAQAVTSAWIPLETTIENGMVCAPLAYYTGVYAPAGK